MDYLAFIKKYLWKDIEDNYTQFSNGWDYDVIISNGLVFRFPKNKEKSLDMRLEKKQLDVVAKYVDIQVPHCTVVDDVCIIYPEIPGITLDKAEHGYDQNILEAIIIFLKQLHAIPLKEFSFMTEEKTPSPDQKAEQQIFVHKLKEKVKTRLEEAWLGAVVKKIHAYMDTLFFVYESPVKAFVHTDIQWKNILYDPETKKITWIIDFTDSRIGGVELDFCHFYNLWEDILHKCIKMYLWYEDDKFFERVAFLAKRWVIFEICNDEVWQKDPEYVIGQLKKYRFM